MATTADSDQPQATGMTAMNAEFITVYLLRHGTVEGD
jgi:hypothetical protein